MRSHRLKREISGVKKPAQAGFFNELSQWSLGYGFS
jgi:hypothetical protein